MATHGRALWRAYLPAPRPHLLSKEGSGLEGPKEARKPLVTTSSGCGARVNQQQSDSHLIPGLMSITD